MSHAGVIVWGMNIDHFDTPHSRKIGLWVLRLFSTDSTSHLFIQDGSYADSDLAQFLKLPVHYEDGDLKDVPRMMSEMLDQLESAGDSALDTTAEENLANFASTLRLNDVETSILTFFVAAECESTLCDSLKVVERPFIAKPRRLLSKVLKIAESDLEAALRKGSRLMSLGLLSVNQSFRSPHLEFFSSDVASSLMYEHYDSTRILSKMGVGQSDAPVLCLADYPHLETELSLLLDYLRSALSRNLQGVNILLYGKPGTGKTQLTRVIARELETPAFDFMTSDSDGDPQTILSRLSSVRIAESFFRDAAALFVFDEMEDIVRPSGSDRGLANKFKGWFNRTLETNSRPIFWLSNSTNHIDAAFCRRFDFVLEVPVPPRSQRANILRQHAGNHLSERAIGRLAEFESLAPAVVTRVTGVFDIVSEKLQHDRRDETFTRMVGAVLKAQGHSIPSITPDEILQTDVYDTSCLNTGADLPEIARMLRSHPHARICLHGPPGTGKTAFGHWLAREIDRPLHIKRASDLLNPFVGGTEMQIAETFEDALRDDAILLIDEVDSFLQDRAKAVRSWEVTQVNELLTRMESFNGVFIATTNRLAHLDAASLRRFDLKLHFDFLNPRQIRDLLGAWCRSLGIPSSSEESHRIIESMECVTPGDFAAVARRHRFLSFANSGQLLQAVSEECAMKPESTRRIGFL